MRSLSKGESAKASVEASTGRTGIAEVWLLDLSSFDSVRAFAKRADRELARIDAVIENAGIALDRWTEAEGHETTIMVNVLGTFLLAILLLPTMKEKGERAGRIPTFNDPDKWLARDRKVQGGQRRRHLCCFGHNGREDNERSVSHSVSPS